MKNQFCKLYNLENHQVLVTKDNEEDNDYVISVRTHVNNCSGELKAHYKTEESRDEDFDSFNHERAKLALESIKELIEKHK